MMDLTWIYSILLFLGSFIIVCFLPGALFLFGLFKVENISGKLLLPIPLSFAIISVFAYSLGSLNLRINLLAFAFLLLILLGLFFYRIKKNIAIIRKDYFLKDRFLIGFAISSILVMFTVLYPLTELIVPTGDDPNYHSLVADNIYRNGVVPITKEVAEPYLFIPKFYPFGLHTILALMHSFSGIPIYTLLLWLSILVSCLLPISFFYFTKAITQNKQISYISSVLSMTFYKIPYEIFMWGGYPYLFGVFFTLITVGFILETFGKNNTDRNIFLSALLLAGIFYNHASDLVVLFLILFIFLPLYIKSIEFKKFIVMCLLFIIFIFPAIFQAIEGIDWYSSEYAKEESEELKLDTTDAINLLKKHWFFSNSNYLLFITAAMGILVVPFVRRKFAVLSAIGLFVILLWYFLFVLDLLPLNIKTIIAGLGPANFKSRRIIYNGYFFIPILSGSFLYFLINEMKKIKNAKISYLLLTVLILIVSYQVFVPLEITSRTNSRTSGFCTPVTVADLEALMWIKDNTPSNATFLNDLMIDSGAWIPLISHRPTLFVFNSNFVEDAHLRGELIESFKKNPMSDTSKNLLAEYNITYIYYGDSTAYNRRHNYLDFKMLINNPFLEKVFDNRKAFVFKILDAPKFIEGVHFVDIGTSQDKYHIGTGWWARENWGNITARWTTTSATTYLMISKGDVIAIRVYPGHNVPSFGSIEVRGQKIPFEITNGGWQTLHFVSPMNSSEIIIKVDNSWTPRTYKADSKDNRTLGIGVDYIKIEEK